MANGAIYGTKDAGRHWYLYLRSVLLAHGMTESRLEKGLYSWFLNGELIAVIHSHVDDLCWAYKKCAVARDMISTLSKVLYLK